MLRYILPSESLLFAPVVGDVDDTYLEAWLTDGEPGHPVVYTGNPTYTVTPAVPLLVDLIVVHHTNLVEAAAVSLGGSLSSTIDPGPVTARGYSPNAYRLLDTPTSVTTLVLGVTGNGAQTVIGGLYAGLSRTLPALRLGRQSTPTRVKPLEGEFSSLAPYAKGLGVAVPFTGSFILTESQLNALTVWHESQDEGSIPAVLLPDYPVGVPIVCQFDYSYTDFAPGDVLAGGSPVTDGPIALFEVTMDVRAYPPIRWPA